MITARIPGRLALLAGLALALSPTSLLAQAGDLDEALEKATKAAVAKAAPSVVQIQTIGGLEFVGGGAGPEVLKGQGPTTGVIVSPDGYIISSSFNFAHKPTTITVNLPDAKDPAVAKIVATDHVGQLTLLKVDAKNLPVPAVVAKKEVKVGQWALAVGRTWSENTSSPPSVSVGVISATERIWGKAFQTDAKISPVNYGGPLIDMQGRVVGILVPMSPRAEGETAGVEWYDSGIGFAVSMEDINRVLPQLKEGKDLKRGVLGITMQNPQNMFAAVVVANVAAGSAAGNAGIKTGDQVIEADGKKITRQSELRHVLGNKYEGDKVSLKVKRGEETIDLQNLILAGEVPSFQHAFLGILPMRDDTEAGVEVRYVYPKSPADTAGVKAGDRILKIENRAVAGRDQLMQALNGFAPGVQVKLEVKRKGAAAGDKPDNLTAKLDPMPETLPASELPPASNKKAKAVGEGKEIKTGFYTKADTTSGREYWVYVPDDYDPKAGISYALVVWLHPVGDPMEKNILKLWQDLCKKHHIILMAPKAENPSGWITSEVDPIKADIREVINTYMIDRQRVVVHGLGKGAGLAYYLGFDARDLVRGVAVVSGILPAQAKENLAQQRLAFLIFAGTRDPDFEALKASRTKLGEKKFPIIYRELANHGNGYINAEQVEEIVRWIDSLDRL